MSVDPHQIRRTMPGMAAWAGGGPPQALCRDCSWFPFDKDASGKSQRCAKFTALSRGRRGPAVPPNASACRYFEARAFASNQ